MRPAYRLALSLILIGCLTQITVSSAQFTSAGVQPGARAWYLPTADKAGELFIVEVGKGPGDPIVVLHGGPGGDLRYLLPIANGLDSLPFVFYDQRGSLLSRVIPDSISMPKHVEDLEQIRMALNAERLRLVSHSAGTMLVFAYLQAHPDRVANLVLLGALPHKNGRPYYDAEYAALWRGLGDTATQFAQRPAVRSALKAAGADTVPLPPRLMATRGHILQSGAEMVHVERWQQGLPYRVNPEAARRTRETTEFTYDVGPLLARHRYPVTVINGEFDYTVGPRGSPLWRRLTETVAPNVRLVVIPDASHLAWRDAPESVRVALRRALAP